jgi:hypothetical protein
LFAKAQSPVGYSRLLPPSLIAPPEALAQSGPAVALLLAIIVFVSVAIPTTPRVAMPPPTLVGDPGEPAP